jgi:hypothetical protein
MNGQFIFDVNKIVIVEYNLKKDVKWYFKPAEINRYQKFLGFKLWRLPNLPDRFYEYKHADVYNYTSLKTMLEGTSHYIAYDKNTVYQRPYMTIYFTNKIYKTLRFKTDDELLNIIEKINKDSNNKLTVINK